MTAPANTITQQPNDSYHSNWISPFSQYNAICMTWAQKISSEMPTWPSTTSLASKPCSFSFPAICLIAEYAPYEPATDWYLTLQKLAQIVPGLLNQKIPPLPINIIGFLESTCPIYGTPHKTKETQVLTLISAEFKSLYRMKKIFTEYAKKFLPGEQPFKFEFFPKKIGNPTISSTYWGLQTIKELPPQPVNLSPKPNWRYLKADLIERFVAFPSHTIAMREKLKENPKSNINFEAVSVLVPRPFSSPANNPLIAVVSASNVVKLWECKTGSLAPRFAAIAQFS